MKAGETIPVKITAYDAQGAVIPNAVLFVQGGPRQAVTWADGKMKATQAGSFSAVAMAFGGSGNPPVTLEIPVSVTWPPLARVEVMPDSGTLYVGVTLGERVRGFHADSSERKGVTATWKSSNPSVATVNRFGDVTAVAPGAVTITVEAEGKTAQRRYTVAANPVSSIDIGIAETSLKTGDVVHLKATAKRSNGTPVADAPITWSYTYVPDDSLVPGGVKGGPGIMQFGRFTANYPGRFTLIAQSGNVTARTAVSVAPRDVRQKITITGRGTIHDTHTSDLWPWTGKDGRDYCLVGTWGGDGYALVFDITDMSNIIKTDSVQVNARTINDVTVSPDGRYGVLSREGASDRINGVVILDLATPAHPKVASTFSQELTGGVHNLFATNDNLFAVSAGTKYVIVDMKDIYHPKYVSEYRHPNARLHDLWVNDGIAYSAQGGAGTVVVDVGNGKYGGTIEKPKLITVYEVNSGHEIFPYFQKKTGKVYLFIGDEEMNRSNKVWGGSGYSLAGADGKPPKNSVAQTSGGYTHIIDFTDPMHPIPVARYHLEDYGSHDIIVQDDILYQAYYDGGVRLVDVSGELMGNLYDQGREIAVFKSYDPDGYTANAPFVMNAMPWKGKVLFTDFNSGLWAAKLEPKPVVP
ncbi:MAG TPA: Ig-like domain-containing protein [Gemmatimonadaceae bacterium]|nr:Ig-like domain-containing protein [Gemmatimonadaceae bacterium]